MEIRSVSNEKIKYLRKAFSSRRFAREENIFFLAGINLYREFRKTGRSFRYILFAPSQLIQKEQEELLRELDELERMFPQKVIRTSKVVLEKFSQVAADQGILVVADRFSYDEEDVLARNRIIFLYEVQDPGNVGTIFRLAEGNGAAIILTKGSASPFNEKCVRASMGSILRTPFLVTDDEEAVIRKLKEKGFVTIATDPRAPERFWEIDYSGRVALILGNEGHGLPSHIASHTDLTVSIPMEGEVESYNVAISSAILLCPSLINREKRQKK